MICIPKSLTLIGLVFFSLIMGCQKEKLSIPGDYNITLYSATYGNGIFITENGGKSWHPLNDVDEKGIHAYFKRIYIDPDNKDLLYVTTTGAGLFRIDLGTGLMEAVDPFRGQKVTSVISGNVPHGREISRALFVGIYGGGVFKKNGTVGTWQPMNRMLIYQDVE